MSQQRVETGPATFGQFIGGTWRAAESGRGFDDMDLWSGDVVAQFAAGSGAERSRPASARTGGSAPFALPRNTRIASASAFGTTISSCTES